MLGLELLLLSAELLVILLLLVKVLLLAAAPVGRAADDLAAAHRGAAVGGAAAVGGEAAAAARGRFFALGLVVTPLPFYKELFCIEYCVPAAVGCGAAAGLAVFSQESLSLMVSFDSSHRLLTSPAFSLFLFDPCAQEQHAPRSRQRKQHV